MTSYLGQTPGGIQGDIHCNALYTQTLQSSAISATLPIGDTYLSAGQLGLDFKTMGSLILTVRMSGGLDPEYATVLAYVSNNAILNTVTLISSSTGIDVRSDGFSLQISNNTPAVLQATFSLLWL